MVYRGWVSTEGGQASGDSRDRQVGKQLAGDPVNDDSVAVAEASPPWVPMAMLGLLAHLKSNAWVRSKLPHISCIVEEVSYYALEVQQEVGLT